MIIELFGEYGRGLKIDDISGAYTVVNLVDGGALFGVGSLINEYLVAIFCKKGKLFLRISDNEWSFDEEFDSIEFCNEKDGESRLIVKNKENLVYNFRYPSWWQRDGHASPVGFGDLDDEEYDIGAYLAFMWKSDQRRKHLIQKYNC